MELKLRLNTKTKVERSLELIEEELEPMSPTSEYLTSEVVTLYVLAFLELAIPVDFLSVLTFLKNDFINVHPRFSSIVIENKKGKKMWKQVQVLNVEDHIKVPTFPENLSSESYSEHFDDYISKIATSQLPQHKPLWELHIINYPKDNNVASTFIFKIHHAIADGTSLMGGVLSCFKRVDDPSLPLTFPSKARRMSNSRKKLNVSQTLSKVFKIVPNFMSSIIYSLYDFGQSLRLIVDEDDQTPIRSGVTDMTLPCSTRVCSVTLPLNEVKRIKTLFGVTVNDIIVGIIFLATRLYIQDITDEEQLKIKKRSTASIFVNIRRVKGNLSLEEMRRGNTWGNRISNLEIPLPNLVDDYLSNPLDFIMRAHKIIKRKRSGTLGLFLMDGLLHAIRTFGGIQVAARTLGRRWRNCSFAITNMIGPTEQVSLANHPIKGFYFVPTGINLSVTVSVLSYMDDLRIGLALENGFIDHQKLITCVENAFQMIFQASMARSEFSVQ